MMPSAPRVAAAAADMGPAAAHVHAAHARGTHAAAGIGRRRRISRNAAARADRAAAIASRLPEGLGNRGAFSMARLAAC